MQKYYPQNIQSIDQSNFNIAACDVSNSMNRVYLVVVFVFIVVVFVFNAPSKANNKVIWRQTHSLKYHLTDW